MFNEEDMDDCDTDHPGLNAAKNTHTYSKKNKRKQEGSPSTSKYIELKNVSHQLRQLHSSIDLVTDLDVSNVTLGTDNEGFVLEQADKEFDATDDLIDVLENTLNENELCTKTARKRSSISVNDILDNNNKVKKQLLNYGLSISPVPSTSTSPSMKANEVATKVKSKIKSRPVVVKVMKGKKTPKAILNKTWDALKGNEDLTVKAEATQIVKASGKPRGRPRTKPENKPKESKISASGKTIEYQQCQLCNYKTRSNVSFIQHQYIHNIVNKVEVYKCDKCLFTSNNHAAMLRHKASHAEQHISYKCTFCDEAFDKKNLCLFHVLKHKEIPDLEELLFCVSNNSLTDEQYYECFQCEYQQQEDTLMSFHILDHQIEKPQNPIVARFKCSRCDYYTKSEDMIAKHNLLHHGPVIKKSLRGRKGVADATTSDSCAPDAVVKLEGQQEELNASKPILRCEQCPFVTRNARSLINHRNLKHKRKPKDGKEEQNDKTPLYFCNECHYSTHRKQNLPRHALIHKTKADMEIFECPHCFFETKHRRSYVRHMKDIHMVIV